MTGQSINDLFQKWLDGVSTNVKVVTDNKDSLDTTNDRERVALVFRTSAASALIGPGQVVDGGETKRAKLEIGGYQRNYLYLYAITKTLSPSVTFRIYLSSDETLQADDAGIASEWVEYKFWKFVGQDPLRLHASVSDATDPSADIVAGVSGVELRFLGGVLAAGGTAVNAGWETDDAATDLGPQFPFAANGGLVEPIGSNEDYYFDIASGKGIQIDKSAAQTVAGHVFYKKHPLILTDVYEGIIAIPEAKAVAVELVNGAAATNQLTFHIRHWGRV